MRLTLRTLLAYLDNILEPADARELGKRIEQSEFASELVHRIRGVTRKLRLGAPKLSGKGMGLDANTVAEYLDNTLPQDRVPDFERVCLESDVHLAEVASCHQILTLVLGEPVDVDPALHDRIVSMKSRLESEETQGRGAADDPAGAQPGADMEAPPIDPGSMEETGEEPPQHAPEAPMVTPSSTSPPPPRSSIRLLPVVLTLVVTFLLAAVALLLMGPLNGEHPILGRMLADASDSESQREPQRSADPEKFSPAGPETGSPGVPKAGAAPRTREDESPGRSPAAIPEELAAGPEKKEEAGADPAAKEDEPSAKESEGAFPVPPGKANVSDDASADTTPDPLAKPEDTGLLTPKGGSESPGAETSETAEKKAPAEPEPLVRCNSRQDILAYFDAETETWRRLITDDAVPLERPLVALPTYRPQFTLRSGPRVALVGPAAVRLNPAEPEDEAKLTVEHGQMVLTNGDAADTTLEVRFGERSAQVTFPTADSSLALDVQRHQPPGKNPEEHSAFWLVQARAVAEQVEWRDGATGETILLDEGQSAFIVDARPPQITTESSPPDWVDGSHLRLIDRDASERLEPLLALDAPLTASLGDQTTSRLVEVRSLAIRSLCELDVYDSFIVDALNSAEYHTFWSDLVSALRRAVARNPAAATRIRSLLERLRGEEGQQLYRFLWGFSPEQLAEGKAQLLVDSLASPSMDVRVLAFENLYRIAEKTNSYDPALPPKRQKRAILNWERDLRDDEIRYETPPFDPTEES